MKELDLIEFIIRNYGLCSRSEGKFVAAAELPASSGVSASRIMQKLEFISDIRKINGKATRGFWVNPISLPKDSEDFKDGYDIALRVIFPEEPEHKLKKRENELIQKYKSRRHVVYHRLQLCPKCEGDEDKMFKCHICNGMGTIRMERTYEK